MDTRLRYKKVVRVKKDRRISGHHEFVTMRELDECINKIRMYHEQKDYTTERERIVKLNEIRRLEEAVSKIHLLNADYGFICKSRKRELVHMRQATMYWLKKNSGWSLKKIGLLLGNKDHATTLHAFREVENAIETKQVTVQMQLILNELKIYDRPCILRHQLR